MLTIVYECLSVKLMWKFGYSVWTNDFGDNGNDVDDDDNYDNEELVMLIIRRTNRAYRFYY